MTRSVFVRSSDVPFRVVRVTGARLVGQFHPSADAKAVHRLDLQFDTSGILGREAFDVCLETDYPDQPIVKVGVLVLD